MKRIMLLMGMLCCSVFQKASACYIGPDDAQQIAGYFRDYPAISITFTACAIALIGAPYHMPTMHENAQQFHRALDSVGSLSHSLTQKFKTCSSSLFSCFSKAKTRRQIRDEFFNKLCTKMPERKARKVCAMQLLGKDFPHSSKKDLRKLVALLQKAHWDYDEAESLVRKCNPKLKAMFASLA